MFCDAPKAHTLCLAPAAPHGPSAGFWGSQVVWLRQSPQRVVSGNIGGLLSSLHLSHPRGGGSHCSPFSFGNCSPAPLVVATTAESPRATQALVSHLTGRIQLAFCTRRKGQPGKALSADQTPGKSKAASLCHRKSPRRSPTLIFQEDILSQRPSDLIPG